MRLRHVIAAAAAAVLAAGCSAPPSPVQPSGPVPAPHSTAYDGVAFIDDIDFGAPAGIRLDVCMPAPTGEAAPAAVVSVHGGGWKAGDKSQRLWRDTCAWLAGEGFVVFQPNYRLAPEHPFPAAITDITRAVTWLRDPAQVARFGHDPARLGAFGDSAGGNLAALLGTRGEGDLRSGTRVAAVVELSAPLDLTRAGTDLGDLSDSFQEVQLDYLGCDSYAVCPVAEAASPGYHLDATDPPFFIAHARDEFIPPEQAEEFVGLLGAAGVEVAYSPVAGSEHALGYLDDDLRATIGAWLRERLAP